MNTFIGFAVIVLLLPAAYATLAYFGVSNGHVPSADPSKGIHFGIAAAAPLVIVGLVKWWDVWLKPGPKLGSAWASQPPSEFLTRVCRNHGIVFAVVIGAGYLNADRTFAHMNQDEIVPLLMKHLPTVLVVGMIFFSVFNIPFKRGFESGQPIQR